MIYIIDFGSQVCHLISKKLHELGYDNKIISPDNALEEIEKQKPRAIIFSGGPDSIYEKDALTIDPRIYELGIPILGICYGHQLMAHQLGGKVVRHAEREYGIYKMKVLERSPLFEGLEDEEQVLMSHADSVAEVPPGFKVIGRTERCIAAMANDEKKLYGIQLQPEVIHTPKGVKILDNFARLAGTPKKEISQDIVDKLVKEIKERVNAPILMAVSGGIDSTVAAELIELAVPDLLHCVFVDTGLLRKNEVEEIKKIYTSIFKNFHFVDASETFLSRLKGVTDPEQKRKIIGNTFIEVFEEKVKELEKTVGKFKFLGQGTIYPDRIESAASSKNSAKIKTHHNVGGLPERLNFELVEPLANMYKYEVRQLARKLDIPEQILKKHPFPGPGLAVRCLGEITKEKLEILREADAILEDELKKANLYDQFWQAFVVLLPVKTVGVMGDERTYEHACVIRIVSSVDGMTADVPNIDLKTLKKIAQKIVNEVKGINRVAYDITTKPPGTIEWE